MCVDITKRFGQLLRLERNKRLLSQEQLAELSDLHRNAIGLIERGERSPSLDTIYVLAKGLSVPASDLLALLEDSLQETR